MTSEQNSGTSAPFSPSQTLPNSELSDPFLQPCTHIDLGRPSSSSPLTSFKVPSSNSSSQPSTPSFPTRISPSKKALKTECFEFSSPSSASFGGELTTYFAPQRLLSGLFFFKCKPKSYRNGHWEKNLVIEFFSENITQDRGVPYSETGKMFFRSAGGRRSLQFMG